MDGAEVHYLSELQIHLTPLHIIEMKNKSKELESILKSELEFTENLDKEGLLRTYIELRFENESPKRYR